VAMAHLAYSVDPQWATCAEFGVSVSPHQRGKGLGAKLFGHAVMHARNQGVSLLFIHALSENVAMLKIARRAGAAVQREGSESEAYLSLPQATLDSQLSGLMQEQMAELDYQLKMQAINFGNGWPRCKRSAKACAMPVTVRAAPEKAVCHPNPLSLQLVHYSMSCPPRPCLTLTLRATPSAKTSAVFCKNSRSSSTPDPIRPMS